MAERHQTHGKHILLDVWGVDAETLNDLEHMQQAMLGAAAAAGATVVDTTFHRFPVQGISGVVVLAESHISVHTFPEHGYAAFDVFTCGSRVDAERACEYLVQAVRADDRYTRRFMRGVPGGICEQEVPSGLRAVAP
jgi:S-adenosylmethionine decarboxylase proenzyme